MKTINDHAVVAYTSLVDDLCRRKAAQNEVELMLDYLLMFAGDITWSLDLWPLGQSKNPCSFKQNAFYRYVIITKTSALILEKLTIFLWFLK